MQGLFLAKKGLWVSEFRIESGLNCGGHAFATDGHLLGPILDEFNQKKHELAQSMHVLLTQALSRKEFPVPVRVLPLRISVQGGVGTADEHDFLLSHYKVDSVGWGSPFLLVPEATSVDEFTRRLLQDAGEDDLYISDISPLGVPFNTVRGTSAENVLNTRVANEKPGSSCPKKYLALNKEYGAEGICTASSKYQKRKIAAIDPAATPEQKREAEARITQKACLCVGLSNAALLEQDIKIKGDRSVVVCPGPNIAYFNGQYSLNQMAAHIYGGSSLLEGVRRPHMFIKELKMYVDHLAGLVKNQGIIQSKAASKIKENILEGITYYESLLLRFPHLRDKPEADVSNLSALVEKVRDDTMAKQLF